MDYKKLKIGKLYNDQCSIMLYLGPDEEDHMYRFLIGKREYLYSDIYIVNFIKPLQVEET